MVFNIIDLYIIVIRLRETLIVLRNIDIQPNVRFCKGIA